MRKLKTSEKRKWIVNGLLAFGAVALLTTGFATWIVGVNQREANGGVSVQVDTAQKNNVSFTFEVLESNKDIYVGEKTSSSSDNFVNITGNDEKDTDFNVGFKFTIIVGKDVAKPNEVNLTINYDGIGLADGTDNSAAIGNKVVYNKDNAPVTHYIEDNNDHEYTYIDISNDFATISIPDSSEEDSDKSWKWTVTPGNDETTYVYETAGVDLFKWGTYFGGKAPSTFYNQLYKGGTLENTSEDVNIVYGQLQAMKEVFMTKTTNEEQEVWEPKTLNVLATLE